MLKLFSADYTIPIRLHPGLPESIAVAAADLQKDLRRLSDQPRGFEISYAEKTADIPAIQIHIAAAAETDGLCAPTKTEGYTIGITRTGVTILGYDMLGAIYGIYAFCRRVLDIDPMHRITGFFPPARTEMTLAEQTFSDYPRGPRFRGWFLNDEDLLTDFRPGGGKRNIDYPFYANVMHPDVLEMVLETALRLGLNLMIPSSFVDIDNPDEEKLVAAACRRGLYVTQHHVEPMGVSYFGADNYIKKNGLSGEVSFIQNRAVMEEIWTHYAEKWAIYGDRVIWQLGLRGKADAPIWWTDKSVPGADAQRGEIIGRAIQTQYDIVQKAMGGRAFVSTSTLWMEGAELYGKGLLKIPEDTIVIFSDIGFNLMFGDDFFTVPRRKNVRYGIYYHVGFWEAGPHLAEGCNPDKICYCYDLARKHGSLYYSILNVTNLREVHMTARMNAFLCWAPADFDLTAYNREYFERHYGTAAEPVAAGYKQYFNAFADLGAGELKRFCHKYHFFYHDYGRLPFINFAANDGSLRTYALQALKLQLPPDEVLTQFKHSQRRLADLLTYWYDIRDSIPAQALTYFHLFPLLQTQYLLLMTGWSIACIEYASAMLEGQKQQASDCLFGAENALNEILNIRTIAQHGAWQGWYNGDKKVNIRYLLRLTRETAEKLQD